MARVEFVDRAGRPWLIVEAFVYLGGAEMSLRVLDQHGAVRLTTRFLVHRRGMLGVAVAVLDRHGTPRALFARFLGEDGSAEVYGRVGRNLATYVVFVRRRRNDLFTPPGLLRLHQVAALFVVRPRPDAHDGRGMPRPQHQASAFALAWLPDRGVLHGAFDLPAPTHGVFPAAAFALAGLRDRGVLHGAFDIPAPTRGVFPAAALGLARLRDHRGVLHGAFYLPAPTRGVFPAEALDRARPQGGMNEAGLAGGLLEAWRYMVVAAGLEYQARHRGFVTAAALVINRPPFALPRATARGVSGPTTFTILAAAADLLDGARLIADTFLRQGGAELSLRMLDRQRGVRLTATLLYYRRGTVGISVAVLDRHGTPRDLGMVVLSVARPRADDNGRGLARPDHEAVAIALARLRGRSVFHGALGLLVPNCALLPAPLPVPALGLPRPHGDRLDLARGLLEAWRHMVIAAGIDHQARYRGLVTTAALVADGPIAPPAAAARGGYGPPRFPRLASTADFLDGEPFLDVPAAALVVREPPSRFTQPAAALPPARPLAVAALSPRAPPRPLGVDAIGLGAPPRPIAVAQLGRTQILSPLPATRGYDTVDDDLLRQMEEGHGLFQRLQTPQSAPTLLRAILALSEREQALLIEAIVNETSEPVRSQIRSIPALSIWGQLDACHPQRNMKGRMWKSFLATIGLSIASNIFLYFLSVGIKLLEKKAEGSSSEWSWVIKFLTWLVERVLSPSILMLLVLLVTVLVIDRERHMLRYENNGKANALINGTSRGFFLGIRSFPGIQDPDLWARLAAVVIDILGAAFLLWKKGHWDPDIADG